MCFIQLVFAAFVLRLGHRQTCTLLIVIERLILEHIQLVGTLLFLFILDNFIFDHLVLLDLWRRVRQLIDALALSHILWHIR